ncbi:MAG TPA: hypothetical protein VFU03_09815, partial [Gemmatimonadales bacterium]|nr:hypothetical protein [Gemmatimonadales bacterium]
RGTSIFERQRFYDVNTAGQQVVDQGANGSTTGSLGLGQLVVHNKHPPAELRALWCNHRDLSGDVL